jgi:hypothetical protein
MERFSTDWEPTRMQLLFQIHPSLFLFQAGCLFTIAVSLATTLRFEKNQEVIKP